MKVAVIGSRGLTVDDLNDYLPEGVTEIVSGGARGIDTCARQYALSAKIKLTEFRPDYERYGRVAPLKRNDQIVDYADHIVAIHHGPKAGDAYGLSAVNEALAQNALKQPVRSSVLDKLREAGNVQQLVDIEAKRAEGKGIGYEKWAQGFNLQQMANTLNAYTDYGFASMDELNELVSAARSELRDSREKLKPIETVLAEKKELLKQLLTYWETKDVRKEYKALKSAKDRAEYAQAHEREFKLSNAASKYFKDHGITKLPSTKALQAEIQQLTSEKNARYKDYREKQRRVKELETVKNNLENMLGHKKEKRHELILS